VDVVCHNLRKRLADESVPVTQLPEAILNLTKLQLVSCSRDAPNPNGSRTVAGSRKGGVGGKGGDSRGGALVANVKQVEILNSQLDGESVLRNKCVQLTFENFC